MDISDKKDYLHSEDADIINPGKDEAVKAPRRKKIDPRKLIIYSEILRPKFDE